MAPQPRSVRRFDFRPGDRLAGKYEVVERLGRGWEGEVYKVRERATGIERAAKFFYPERNMGNRAVSYHARKLNRLRHCRILIAYLTHDHVKHDGRQVPFLVSEFVEGEVLEEFIRRRPGKRLPLFEALHLLHALAAGLEEVHALKDYHGDLHSENIIVARRGIHFEVKLIDFYRWKGPTGEHIREDVRDIIRIFYDALGGQKYYAKQPKVVKDICLGLKRGLIRKRFRTAGALRQHLETMSWDD
ncbi:tRNA A-37 threonylcarbamoyl transferase component Bud32 [Natronospira proteinivora]|uniref:tRNA A-37 threonylcarbamoyl transferase component Bud32 n=1 Tax=Natronospira proteinivora TaxID=1807133 RepID=A0ABT1GAF2_9GAMM|nr:protein kinase [Natronospira proteinivora]MCP1728251.1 tRNA A-37 threonylcarbamoyl transferase component Bud32 [Natronospira proteinivora]